MNDYRNHPAVNFSSLKHILTSPAHYKAALEAPREETPAMRLGTLTHSCVLEGKNLFEIAAMKPQNLNLATKEGKAWKESQTLPIISGDDVDSITGMVLSTRANPHAAHVLKQCPNRETPLFATIRGVECKALLDAHGTDGEQWWIADLKTTDDASPEAFARNVANLHYDMQAAFYCAVLGQAHQIETEPYWLWIAVEKNAPYTCAVYDATEWMESGQRKLETALELYKECKAKGEWPQPWQGISKLPKPKWA